MCSLLIFNIIFMKKVISISAEESVIEDFTILAQEFWTNRTNLISMFMVDVIRNKKIYFRRESSADKIEFEAFSEEENNSLKEWENVYNAIFNTLDLQLWK